MPGREHREMGFYFFGAFAAFAANDLIRVGAALIGMPMNFAGIMGILGFFALILWFSAIVFPRYVAPRLC